MKNILVLGAGLVAKPLVRYLLDHPDFKVTVASRTVSKAVNLIDEHPDGKALPLNVIDEAELEKLVFSHDLTISLVPYTHHVKIAKMCIKHKKNMVTTSYVSKPMAELDQAAKDAGILILNEIGLDPGIDHMSAMRIIDDVKSKGGKIVSFRSYCGGLPAPEANDNPFGYKFSWSPRGVVMAGSNNGRYLQESKEVFVPGKELFTHYHHREIEGVGELEAYPNRDSVPYIDTYGIQNAETMYRGTFRNIGWCDTLKAIADLGYLSEEEKPDAKGKTYGEFTAMLVGGESENVKEATAEFLNISPDSDVIERLEWLGLFSITPLSESSNCALDFLADIMLEKMPYREGERDMIVLFHDFIAQHSDGKKQNITSTLVDFGIPGGDSSMSRTVSLPAAVATKLILEGKISLKGVHIPNVPEVYNPTLDELETMNIKCVEEYKPL
ncbi:MAG: saccharopine dehydrogenase [candidate division Zixibacteria bacterium]|nr:saccharopine dehydrogenase [candidate division Zixibacteria bacterium]